MTWPHRTQQERPQSFVDQTRLRFIRFSEGIGEIHNAACPAKTRKLFPMAWQALFRQWRSPPPA